jgi:hypothetical protein
LELGKISVPKRFLFPLLVALAAKIAGGIYMYYSMNVQSLGTFWSDPSRAYNWVQNEVFLQSATDRSRWPLAFVGWDSAWYLSIMTKGYAVSTQSYAFSPGLPYFANVVNFLIQNPMTSMVLVSLVFGVLWIPLYQMLAERYMSWKPALLSTLLFVFSPYLFVFTTVAYSESLMLFFVLGAWVLFKKGKVLASSTLAAVAPLTRFMGILVVLPMLCESLKSSIHRKRNVMLSLLPIASLSAWIAGLSFVAGDFFPPSHTSEWNYLYSLRTLITEGIPTFGIKAIFEAPCQNPPISNYWLLPVAIGIALIFPLIMFSRTWKMDKSLWLYAVVGYVVILGFGALVSTPRFISVFFPLWIPLTSSLSGSRKSIAVTIFVSVVFFIGSLDLWASFLRGQFVA